SLRGSTSERRRPTRLPSPWWGALRHRVLRGAAIDRECKERDEHAANDGAFREVLDGQVNEMESDAESGAFNGETSCFRLRDKLLLLEDSDSTPNQPYGERREECGGGVCPPKHFVGSHIQTENSQPELHEGPVASDRGLVSSR